MNNNIDVIYNLKIFLILGSIMPVIFAIKWIFHYIFPHRPEHFPTSIHITNFNEKENKFYYNALDLENDKYYQWDGRKWIKYDK
jgi:hypothetical protein